MTKPTITRTGPDLADLPLARPHSYNWIALRDKDCHCEEHCLGERMGIHIKVGRTETGWHGAYGYDHKHGSYGGPVFLRAPGQEFESATSAREAMLEMLADELDIAYAHMPERTILCAYVTLLMLGEQKELFA